MYGKEYLEWCEQERLAGEFGEFLAGFDADDRVVMEGILRKRYAGQTSALQDAMQNTSQHQLLQQMGQRSYGGVLGLFGL